MSSTEVLDTIGSKNIFLSIFPCTDTLLINSLRLSYGYMRRWIGSSLVQIMACRLFGLSPVRRQAIIWTNTGKLLIGPLGTNFREILIGIQTFSFKKLHLKTSAKWRLFCLGLNELTLYLRPQPNGHCLANVIFNSFSWMKIALF